MAKPKSALSPASETKLTKAIESRDAPAVERLVATGIDVNVPLKGAHNETPLYMATRYGANDVAVVLFKAGAKCTTFGRISWIRVAVKLKHWPRNCKNRLHFSSGGTDAG